MRASVYTSLALCLLLAMSSCSGEEERIQTEEHTPVLLRLDFASKKADISIEKAKARNLIDGVGTEGSNKTDRIGVYITGTGHRPYTGSDGQYTFVTTDANGATWQCYAGTSPTTASSIYLSNLTATLQAFYPADATVTASTGNGNHTIPVTIPATQTFNGGNIWECSATDYMYASGSETTLTAITLSNQSSGISNGTLSQTVYMYHALTQLIFQIKNTEGKNEDEYNYVKSITLTAASGTPFKTSTGTMNIKDGTLAGLTGANTLSFSTTAPAQIGSGDTTVGYGLAAPISSTGGITLAVTLGKQGDTDFNRTLTATLPTTEWKQGYSCTYRLELKGHILVPTGITISERTETVDNDPILDVD